MKLKKTLFIVTAMILFSGCSSKDAFSRWGYNWLQDEKFCTNKEECNYKKLHAHEHTQNRKMSYDEYKRRIK